MNKVLSEKDNIFFMAQALRLAGAALKRGEVPVGALIVTRDGKILASASNNTEKMKCQTGHAEIRAIRKASKKIKDWRLDGCTIYITLEPCLMCFGLIKLSRISEVVYGTKSPLFGAGLDNEASFPVYKNGLKIKGGLLSDKSSELLKLFFKQLRSQKELK